MATPDNLRAIEKAIYAGKKLTTAQKETLRKKVDEYWDDHNDVGNRFPRFKKYMAWVAGYQLYDYNRLTRELLEMPLRRKNRLVFNRLRAFVRALLAKLNSDVPQMSVIPRTSEDADIEAARAGDKLIEHLADKVNMPKILNDAKLWSIVLNRSFLRVFWDAGSEGTITYKNDDDTGEEVEIYEEGDINMECVSPFHCRVDPLYFEQEKWRWFVFGEEVDAKAIEEEYDLKKDSLQEQSTTLSNAFDIESYDDHGINAATSDVKDDITGRTVVFKEFWTPKVFAYVVCDQVVDYGVNEDGEIPFYPIEERLIPISSYEQGFQYNEGLVKDAIAIQREYNRMYSIKSIALERASKMKVLVPFGSMISKKQFTNDYGVFIDYNPKMGAEPHQMRLDPLPSFIETYTQNLERELEVAFGVREASFGRLPERASHASGTLVNLLLEQDDVLLNPLLSTINTALSKAWSLALRKVQANYDMPRLIKYVGEDGQRSVEKFRAADLKGNTDVKVVSQAGLPRSRALRIEYIMKLREVGLLTDDKQTLELLEFGQADKIFKDNLLHERQAYKENEQVKEDPEITPESIQQQDEQGQPQDAWIHPLEEKQIHAVIHSRLIFGAEFDRLSPNQQATINAHAMATVTQLQQEQDAAMQKQLDMAAKAKAVGLKPLEGSTA